MKITDLIDLINETSYSEALTAIRENEFSEADLSRAFATMCFSFYDIDLELLEELLKKGANPNQMKRMDEDDEDEDATSLLYHVVWFKHDEGPEYLYKVCDIFFRYGADPNYGCENEGSNPFYVVCNFLWEGLVDLFLKYGALPDQPDDADNPQETALYELFTRMDDDAAITRLTRTLLDAGAKADVPCSSWKRTPLMMAARNNRIEAVELLLNAGADANRQDKYGESAMDMAIQNGFVEMVALLEKYGGQISEHERLSVRLVEAFNQGDFHECASIADTIVEQNEDSNALTIQDLLIIAHSYAQAARFDEAVNLLRSRNDIAQNQQMISALINALAYSGSCDDAVNEWQKYKPQISSDDYSNTMIASLLYAYDQLGRAEEGLEDLHPWFSDNGDYDDDGLMKFNAACLYSVTGNTYEAYRMAWEALQDGKDKESFYEEAQLENLRQLPVFELLMKKPVVVTAAFEHEQDKRYREITLDFTTVTIREQTNRLDINSCQVKSVEHDDRIEAILDYQKQIDLLQQDNFIEVQPVCIDYWNEAFINEVQATLEAQQAGNLPQLRLCVIEWDFGDDECTHKIRIAWYDDSHRKEDEGFECQVYGDNTLSSKSLTGPPIRTAANFEKIITDVIATKQFKALNKLSPFYFVFQEHDAGHIHTVKV